MKRLLGLTLLMGGCSAKTGEVTEPESVAVKASALPDAQDLRTVDKSQIVGKDGLTCEVNRETPFTEIATFHNEI